MVPIRSKRWCTEANEATQTHCNNPVVPTYPVWTCYAHGRQVDNADPKRILLASPPADWRRQLGRPRITWLSAVQQDLKQHHRSSRFSSEPPSVEDDVDVWRYAFLELHARNDEDDDNDNRRQLFLQQCTSWASKLKEVYLPKRMSTVVNYCRSYVIFIVVEFYLYPTVGTVLIHSVKPELTE